MPAELPHPIEWLEPWQRLEGSSEGFVGELQKEISPQHVLHGLTVVAVARRIDCDDVLFATVDPAMLLAVVHLTWAGRMESDRRWPHTTGYKSWEDWSQRCLLPDHQEYCGNR